MRWNSSTERDLVTHLDAKEKYKEFLNDLRVARDDRNVKKMQTLIQQFIAVVHIDQVIDLMQEDKSFSDFVQMANYLKGEYLTPPKAEIDLGAITFNITRPAIVGQGDEVEENKQLPE